MNPDVLRQQDKKLLNPSAPGVITHLIYGAILVATSAYTLYAWRIHGIKFLAKPKLLIPLAGVFGVNFVFQEVANRCR